MLLALAAVGSNLTTVAPGNAQENAATPAQSLDCAIWFSNLVGTATDPNIQMGAAAMVGLFVGRYELATGRLIDDEMVERTLTMDDEDLAAVEAACAPQALAFGSRMTALGNRIVAEAKSVKR